ncbi:TPA: LysR family transcriptional regulator [Providencia rettgeri]
MNLLFNNNISFRKLGIFITFMKKGSIAKTAEALNLSNVSVHRALHSLEDEINCPLFIHKGRNLISQPAANILLKYCQESFQHMSNGLIEARKAAGIGKNHLRIGTLYSLTLETVPLLLKGMKLRRPDLNLHLTMGSNQTLLNLLEEGMLDAILLSLEEKILINNNLVSLPLFYDDIYLAAPMSVKLDTSSPADLRDYQNIEFVSLAEGFATYEGFQNAFHIAGFEPKIITQVNDIFSMLSLVQAGVGFTLMPGRMKSMYQNSVQLLKLAEPYQMQQAISIAFPRNRERDPNLLALVAEVRMYTRNLHKTTK